MADEVVGVGPSPETTVLWKDGEPFCPSCNESLAVEGSVTFTERYEASVYESPFGVCIKRAYVDFSTEACCSSCGQMLDYDDVD
jgi:hypothetical protein